LEGMPVL